MTRLQKFVEQGPYGERTGRVAFAFLEASLTAREGFSWKRVTTFRAGDELLTDPGLKEVFKTAIDNGFAIVNDDGPNRRAM